MSRVLLLTAVLALLAACGTTPATDGRSAVFAQCNAICYAPCVAENGDTGVRWEGDPEDPAAWDALGDDVVGALRDQVRTCEVRRGACVQCLERLEAAGVIQR